MNKQEQEQEFWENVHYRMHEEGFDYCFQNYSDWQEIKDKKFHQLREAYLKSAKELKEYVEIKYESM